MRPILSGILYLLAIVIYLMGSTQSLIHEIVWSVPVDYIIGMKLSFKFETQLIYYLSLFLLCAASLYAVGSKNKKTDIPEFLLIVLGTISFAATNVLTIFVMAEMSFLIILYALDNSRSIHARRMRMISHVISGLMLACLALISYRNFVSSGMVGVSNKALHQMIAQNPSFFEQLVLWIIPTVYFLSRLVVAPINWISRPLLIQLDGRQLGLLQIVGFIFSLIWVKDFLFPLIEIFTPEQFIYFGWALLAIALYQLILLIGSTFLKEMLYAYMGFFLALFYYALLMTSSTGAVIKWGVASYFIIAALIGTTVHFFEKRFGSSSLAVIEHSSKYTNSMMRLMVMMMMTMMIVPGSVGFVFMYSILGRSFNVQLALGVSVLFLWIVMVFSLVAKMQRVILKAPSVDGGIAVPKQWIAIFSLLCFLSLLLGLFPNW